MSNSRATTPTHNPPDSAARPAQPSTRPPVPRPSAHDSNTTQESINEPHPTPESSTTMRAMVHDPSHPRSPIARGVVRPAPDDLERPSVKRIRTKSTGSPDRSAGLASPSSDSQGGMADSEPETKPGEDPSQQPPPKKKRTRTLTTPHQAAVLHALLAQSRFPTTAMREEVGRSIGLSARKVQIWFQNQRQKARRPRNQTDATTSRPPQFGPYPIGSAQVGPAGSYPAMAGVIGSYTHPSTSRTAERGESHPDPFRHHSVPLPSAPASDEPPRLLGPGVPGASDSYARHTRMDRIDEWPVSAPPTESRFAPETRRRYGSPPPPTLSPAYPPSRPLTSQPRGWRERDMSRTLPPLIPTRPSTSSSLGLRHSFPIEPLPPSHVTIPALLASRRSHSPEPRFAHQPPEITSSGRGPVTLPPPYTLQPAPQWDNSAYAALSRPSSSWSRPASRSSERQSPISPPLTRLPELHRLPGIVAADSSPLRYDLESIGSPQPPSPQTGRRPPSPAPPPRSGRYDPVREIFVPFTNPSSPATQSPSQAQGEEKTLEPPPSEEKL